MKKNLKWESVGTYEHPARPGIFGRVVQFPSGSYFMAAGNLIACPQAWADIIRLDEIWEEKRMTPERAKEILFLGARWSNWSKHCTPEEHRYVNRVWDTMPGNTCFYDALVRVSKGGENK